MKKLIVIITLFLSTQAFTMQIPEQINLNTGDKITITNWGTTFLEYENDKNFTLFWKFAQLGICLLGIYHGGEANTDFGASVALVSMIYITQIEF